MSSTLSDVRQRAVGTEPAASRRPSASPPTPAATPAPVKVLLVDADRGASYSLWALLNWRPGLRVRATAESSAAARRMVRRLRPDVCLVSATLACREGGRLTHELKQAPGPTRVLIYADRMDARLSAMAMICGADGAFSRYGDPEELADLIERVAANETAAPPMAPEEVRGLIDRVDDKDRSITAMLLVGIAPDEIAWTLGISCRALNARRAEILSRLSASIGVTGRVARVPACPGSP